MVAGQLTNPGDVIVADDDGVCVVPRESASEALAASTDRLDKEAASRKRLAAGELGLDMYGLRAKLIALGVEYVDEL